MIRKKEWLIEIIFFVVMVIAILGVSYAAFSYTKTGTKLNQINSGVISMLYEESSNVINMTGALPTTDTTGKVQLKEGEYFDFSIKTNIIGEANINFEVAAEELEGNTIDGSNIKYYLTKVSGDGSEEELMIPMTYQEEVSSNDYTGRPSGLMSLYQGSINTQGEVITNYRLRLYVTEEYNPQDDGGGLIYRTRINVYGKVGEAPKPVMKAYTRTSTDDYHSDTYKSSITSLVVKDNVEIPSTAIENWDVSEAGNGSVIAYVENDGSGNGTYKVTIGGENGVLASSGSNLFYNFSSLTSIDLTNLYTSMVTDMSRMFYDCRSLTSLDLSSFDTSSVTDMNKMFSGCSSLPSLDLSSFDTSSVTDMNSMFWNCSSLTSLDLSHLDTSSVTNMMGMFYNCSSLESLDLANFNTSSATRMTSMFKDCNNLTSLNLSSFNTSNVTIMDSMFSGCSSLTSLDLSSFDTSSATRMSYMFKECSSLTSLDLTSFNTSSVTIMNYMFYETTNLNEVKVSSLWTTANATTTDMFTNSGVSAVTVV